MKVKAQSIDVHVYPVQTPASLDNVLCKHLHLFCHTFSANVGHYMDVIEAYRVLDRVNTDIVPVIIPSGVAANELSHLLTVS